MAVDDASDRCSARSRSARSGRRTASSRRRRGRVPDAGGRPGSAGARRRAGPGRPRVDELRAGGAHAVVLCTMTADDRRPTGSTSGSASPATPASTGRRCRASTCSASALDLTDVTRGQRTPWPAQETLHVDHDPGDLPGGHRPFPSDRAAPRSAPAGRRRGPAWRSRSPRRRRETAAGARARPGSRRWSHPAGSDSSIAAHVAASHHASSRGVPSTGRVPDPTAAAVSSSVTVRRGRPCPQSSIRDRIAGVAPIEAESACSRSSAS